MTMIHDTWHNLDNIDKPDINFERSIKKMARPGKAFVRFIIFCWNRVRGVPPAKRFTVMFVVLLTASALTSKANSRRKKRQESQVMTPPSHSHRRRTSVSVPLLSSKVPDSPPPSPSSAPMSSSKSASASSSPPPPPLLPPQLPPQPFLLLPPPTILTRVKNTAGVQQVVALPRSLLDGLTGVGAWIETLCSTLAHKVSNVRTKINTAALNVLSATKIFFENTRTVVQRRAAAAITKTALQNIEPLLVMVSLQVKRRMKDQDMPLVNFDFHHSLIILVLFKILTHFFFFFFFFFFFLFVLRSSFFVLVLGFSCFCVCIFQVCSQHDRWYSRCYYAWYQSTCSQIFVWIDHSNISLPTIRDTILTHSPHSWRSFSFFYFFFCVSNFFF